MKHSETAYQFISGTVYFLAPLQRAVGSVVAHDLLFYGGLVVSPRRRLDHALQDAESQFINLTSSKNKITIRKSTSN